MKARHQWALCAARRHPKILPKTGEVMLIALSDWPMFPGHQKSGPACHEKRPRSCRPEAYVRSNAPKSQKPVYLDATEGSLNTHNTLAGRLFGFSSR